MIEAIVEYWGFCNKKQQTIAQHTSEVYWKDLFGQTTSCCNRGKNSRSIQGTIYNGREEIATERGEMRCYSFELRGTITTYTIETGVTSRHQHGPLDPLGRIGTLSAIPHT